MSPCRRMVSRLPARWCRSSTFCVTTDSTPGRRRSNSPSARCPAFGCAARTPSRRSAYQSHTSAGSARKPSTLASCAGSKRDHSPVSASRKVAMPLSADMPAPLSTQTRPARAMRSRSARTGSSSSATALPLAQRFVQAHARWPPTRSGSPPRRCIGMRTSTSQVLRGELAHAAAFGAQHQRHRAASGRRRTATAARRRWCRRRGCCAPSARSACAPGWSP